MTKRTKLLIIGLVVFVLAFAVVALLRGRRPVDPSDNKIGAVLALTGRGATYGERARKGMQLALDEVNSTEPFRAHPIQLIIEDSQSAAPQAVSAFRKLIDVDRVPVALGFVLSDEVLACAPVANERKVVLFSTAAGSDKIKDAGDYVFRNRESAVLQSNKVASACIQQLGIKEIAILHANSANGVSYRDSFKEAVERLGGTISLIIGYDEGKTDFRAEITQLRTKAPKAVYLAGIDQDLGLILKQSREAGFAPQFLASPGAVSPKLLELAGNGAEGLISASAPFDVDLDDSRVRAFVAAYKGRYGDTPDFVAANSYDAIYVLAAMFRNGAKDSEQIKANLYATKDFDGVGGDMTFDPNGEVLKPLDLLRVQNGKFTKVE